MSRVLMLDVGDTLIHDGKVLPHVHEALQALSALTDDKGKPVALALVSDTEMPAKPATPAKIKPIFDAFVAMLDKLDLRRFFEPPAKHVTLSAHAGVFKPDRRVFELALKRLGVKASLSNVVFVTESEEHVRHCRDALKMKALQFGKDFSDWSEAPLLVASLIGPTKANLAAALAPWGAAHDLGTMSVLGSEAEGKVIHAQALALVRLSGSGLNEAEGAYVKVPVRVELHRDAAGRIAAHVSQPSEDDVKEATSYVEGLVARGEIGGEHGPLTTHTIETDDRGRRLLKRRGFKSAI